MNGRITSSVVFIALVLGLLFFFTSRLEEDGPRDRGGITEGLDSPVGTPQSSSNAEPNASGKVERAPGSEREPTTEEVRPPTPEPSLRARLVDEEGRGVTDAAFAIHAIDPRLDALPANLGGVNLPPAASGRTDADGNVTVSDLPREKLLELRVKHPDWLSPDHRFTLPALGPHDLGPLVLRRAAAFTGIVLGPSGPLEDAFVRAFPAEEGAGRPFLMLLSSAREERAPDEVSTDAQGRFRLGGQPPNASLELVVRAPGAPALRHMARAPGVGQEREVTLRFDALGEIRGRVVSGGASVPAARVNARRQGAANPLDIVVLARPAVTGADGTFRLWGLPPGTYDLSTTVESVPVRETDVPVGSQGVDLVVPSPGGLDVRVESVGTGEPLAGARVSCRPDHRSGSVGSLAEIVTDERGTATFEKLMPGDYLIAVDHPERFLPERVAVRVEPGTAAPLTLRLEAGATLDVLVRDAEGEPLAKATVRARGTADPSWGLVQPARHSTTDAAGRARLKGLGDGPHEVSVSHASFSTEVREVELTRGGEESLEVDLGRGATLLVRVLTSSGEPAPGRRVLLHRDRSSLHGTTDANGEYAFSRLVPGSYELTVQRTPSEAPNFVTLGEGESRRLDLGSSDTREVTFTAPPEAALLVRLADDVPVEIERGARATVLPAEKATGLMEVLAARSGKPLGQDGTLRFAGLPPGRYVGFFLVAGAHVPIRQELDLVADETVTWTVRPPRGRIEGRVVGSPGGEGLPGVRVAVRALREGTEADDGFSGLGLLEVLTDEGGSFAIQPLPGGTFLLEARVSGFALGRSEPIEVADGALASGVLISLERTFTLSGAVRVPPGIDPTTLRVLATGPEEERLTASVDATSAFRLEGLRPGSWTLTTRASGMEASTTIEVGNDAPGPIVLELSRSPR